LTSPVTSICDDRPLTAEELHLVRWLLEHGSQAAAGLLPRLAHLRVASRCYCGCASVDFAVDGVVPLPKDMHVLSDYEYRSPEGRLCGAFVFERAGLLAGLEVWSIDGGTTPSTLPRIEQLRPIGTSGHGGS
jgi:hypothetical protein